MNGFKRDIKPKEDMNMKKNTETAKIPMINQVLKDAALGHLAECGLPQSLISGVDCSSYERMEETLLEVKNCFYSSVRKNIEDTYGPSCRVLYSG